MRGRKLVATGAQATPRDKPWLFRTYAGHSTAAKSNELYRTNLAKGQTGLSVAFDLPTQTAYDSDHELARGEVGKVGVPVCHLGDMRDPPRGHSARANEHVDDNQCQRRLAARPLHCGGRRAGHRAERTRGHDSERHHQGVPFARYLCVSTRAVVAADQGHDCLHLPRAAEVESNERLFLSPAGGGSDAGAGTGVCAGDRRRPCSTSCKLPATWRRRDFGAVVGRISFFVNAGLRFVTEICKMRAFSELWQEITAERYGVSDPKHRLFRYGVQVNSLGLTESQPENNVYRILLEMLAVTLSKDARARAVQLPAWNEALGLPRPWDQQWSMRMQQILAYETDLLEYGDIFQGSKVVDGKVEELKLAARDELARIEAMGGAVAAIDYMKERLVASNSDRFRRIESGEQVVVGVNRWTESEPSPLSTGGDAVQVIDPAIEAEQIAQLAAWRAARDAAGARAALAELRRVASEGGNIMEPSIACAKAGVTTGEWGQTLRGVFGEYRAPTGIGRAIASADDANLEDVRSEVERVSRRLGRRIKLLVGKPGLDGHSNGAEQIAVRARDCGMEVVYEGIRLTPQQIVRAAIDESRPRDRPLNSFGKSCAVGRRRHATPEAGGLRRRARCGGRHHSAQGCRHA